MKTKNYKEKTKSFFSKQEYINKVSSIPSDVEGFSPAAKYEFIKFFNFLNPQKKDKLIELGSGYGRFVISLLQKGYFVAAVDISSDSLKLIENEAVKRGLQKKLLTVESDFTKPKLINQFDKAFCISTFHLLAAKESERIVILSNLVKSIKKGGELVVIDPNPLNPFYYPFYWFSSQVSWEVEKHFMRSTEWNLRKIFKNLGLKNIEVSYVGFFPLRFMNMSPVFGLINSFVNRIPLLNKFSSFIYIKGIKK